MAEQEKDRELNRARIESQRDWIGNLQRRVDNQQHLVNQNSLMIVEQHDDIIRLQSRVSHLEIDLPSSSKFAQNLRKKLESTLIRQCSGLKPLVLGSACWKESLLM